MFDAKQRKGIIERTQIPLILAWAVTAHKLQGSTVNSAVIDWGPSLFAQGHAFVMLSRVRSLDRLLLCNFAPTRFDPNSGVLVNDEAKNEMERLRRLPKLTLKDKNITNDENTYPKRIL